jgi:2-polyprenyl-3-methyl-5-hydroxy-6-metoxy-1,4-benzoquinol methylase
MDEQTIDAYDLASADYASDWAQPPPPSDMYALLQKFFRTGPTIDVGCGAGRDVAWLIEHGFDAKGVDASRGLLAQARKNFPGILFEHATLPDLSALDGELFENVLCETVLMHLEEADVAIAARSLINLLSPGGTLYLSWRVTPDTSIRDSNSRLYSSFDKDIVLRELKARAVILFDREDVSESSRKIIHRVIARRFE